MFDYDNFFLSTEKIPVLYKYFEDEAEWGEDSKGRPYQYIERIYFVPTLVAKKMNVSRQTIYNRYWSLRDKGWIEETEDKIILRHTTKHGYSNVDSDVVDFFETLGLDQDILALYSYLSTMWDYHMFKEDSSFFFSKFHIITKIFKQRPTEALYKKIEFMLSLMDQIGLIEALQDPERDRIYITELEKTLPRNDLLITEFKPYGSRKVLF